MNTKATVTFETIDVGPAQVSNVTRVEVTDIEELVEYVKRLQEACVKYGLTQARRDFYHALWLSEDGEEEVVEASSLVVTSESFWLRSREGDYTFIESQETPIGSFLEEHAA